MFLVTSIRIFYRACQKWSEHGGTRLGAALAYYALFSVTPLLLIAIHITGSVFGEKAARGEVTRQLQNYMGKDIADNVEGMVKQAAQPEGTGWTPMISILFLTVASLGAFLYVRSTLCQIWDLTSPAGAGWLDMIWDYALSLIMVFLTSLMLLISLTIGLAIPILQTHMDIQFVDEAAFWRWVEIGISFVFLTALFAISYRTLSGGRISWGYVWYGAIIAALLFTVGKTLLSFYIEYSEPGTMYGAAGSVVVFLVWVYYSSQVMFFGAELIQARRTRYEWLYGQAPLTKV